MQITINDIANALNLSRNTVSRALNGRGTVAKNTRLRVLEAAKALGYGAPALIGEQNADHPPRVITFITRFDAEKSYFFSSIISSIENWLSTRGCILNFVSIRHSDLRANALPSTLSRCDGIICADIFHEGFLCALFASCTPVVLIDSHWDMFKFNTPYTAIMMENDRNVEILTSELISRGHERIAFVGEPKYCRGYYERHRGYVMAHVTAGRLPDPALLLRQPVNESLEMVHKMVSPPTAYVCAGDAQAIEIMLSLTREGIKIPDEIEVVGFDDLPQGEIITPGLTTVHTFTSQIGKCAARALLQRIETPGTGNEIIYLPTIIKRRNSTQN